MIDQSRPRAVVMFLFFLFAAYVVSLIWKNRETSMGSKSRATVVVIAFFGVAGSLLAFKVHWYPATDGLGPP
jgi:Kef-type K+ transport system membrane component KefB